MIILTVIFVVYFLVLIVLLVGWKKAARHPPLGRGGKESLISVIVAVRNEERVIERLLYSLSGQDYHNFEIIVVNDHSEDDTLGAIARSGVKNVRVIDNLGTGKKDAITAGVRAAKGSIVAMTDADCTVVPGWLKEIREAFRDPRAIFVFGGVRMEGAGSFFDVIQGVEFASLVGVGAATASLGAPTMCNGANLAFRKKAFSDVRGYVGNSNIPSGDDEFLMRKIQVQYPDSIRFLYAKDALVTTIPQPDVRGFLHQRIRWASKWRHNSSLQTRVAAVAVVLFQLTFVANWVCLLTSEVLQSLFLLSLKMIFEAAFLLQVCRFLNVRWKWKVFFALQILYPLYVTWIATASFIRPFVWKDRLFNPR